MKWIPAKYRHWAYRTAVMITLEGPDNTVPWTANWQDRPWYVKYPGFAYRVFCGPLIQARRVFPELRGFEFLCTVFAFAGLRFHTFLLTRAWANVHHIRKISAPRRVAGSPLRVMHVTSSFDIGGTQTQIRNLCTAAAATMEHTATEIFPELNFLYRQGMGLEQERYMVGGPMRRAIGRCVLTISTRSLQLIQAYKIYRDLVAYRPDVVVGWGHEMCATTFVAATMAKVPHIVFCIRTFNPAYGWAPAEMGRLLHLVHRRVTPLVSAVITNSTPLREDHSKWIGIEPGRIAVCPNGIERLRLTASERHARRLAMRGRLGISEDVTVATNVGRFSAEKGQQTIVAINQQLMRDYGQRLIWLLGGDGPTLGQVRAQADAAGMTNVRFLGRITGVQDYLCASDIFVMPSDFEGMPNAMMEAMACGLPCVSTDRSGAIDVARHGLEALFYKVGDLAAMEQHVRFLLDHPDEARALGQRAQARLNEFSAERSLERFEQILDTAVSQPAPLQESR